MRVRVTLLHVCSLPCCAALLSGCYAGIAGIAAIVAGQSSSGGSEPTWEVTELQVSTNLPLQDAASTCPEHPDTDGAPCSDVSRVLFDVAAEAGLGPYASGAGVHLDFRLERSGVREGSSVPLILRISAEGASSKRLEVGKFTEGVHELSWDSTPYGRSSPENVLLSLGPESLAEDQTLSRTVLVDNRAPTPMARLCGLKGMECEAGVQDVVELLFSIDAPSVLPAAPFDPKPTCFIDQGGSLRSLPLDASKQAPDLCDPEAPFGFVALWNTIMDAPDRSAEALGLVLVEDRSGRYRPRASILTCPTNCFRINNSRPRIGNLSVRSDPRGAGIHSEELVGRVVFEYDAFDTGMEKVTFHLSVRIADRFGSFVTLSTDDGSLSEGGLSEGTEGLVTSLLGSRHTFIWNSDHDIDALLRQGRLAMPFIPEAEFTLKVTNENSCISSEEIIRTFVLNNRLVHSVLGVLAGRTLPGELTVARNQIVFDTLAGVDPSPDLTSLFLADSGANCVWRMDFRDDAPELRRVAGNGTRRFDLAPGEVSGGAAYLVPLDTPVDVATTPRLGEEGFIILEGTGILWEVASATAWLLFDGRGVLHRPTSIVVENVGGEDIIYIADTGNCRVIRFFPSTGEADVILGALRTLRPGDDPLFQGQDPFPLTNGCNFLELARELLDEPFGLTVRAVPTRRMLLVSDTLGNRLLGLDLGPAGDPDSTPAGDATVLLSQDMEPLFCGPSALRLRGQEIFVASRQVNFSTNASKGVVFRALVVDGPEAGLRLSGLQPVAGGLRRASGDAVTPSCEGTLNEASTYVPAHECLPALDAPLAKPTDLVLDAKGSLYICDSRNSRLRKLGNGGGGCLQPGHPAPHGITNDDKRLVTFVGSSVEGRGAPDAVSTDLCPSAEADVRAAPAATCNLSEPIGMALVDDRLLFVCDRSNHRVLRIDLKTGLVAAVAGRAQSESERDDGLFFKGDGGLAVEALLSSPNSVAVSPAAGFCEAAGRSIFISDSRNHRIRRVDASGTITTVAGSGSSKNDTNLEPGPAVATSVGIPQPRAVLVDSAGRVLIADGSHRMLSLHQDTGMLHWIAGLPQDDPRRPSSCVPGKEGAECQALSAVLNQPSQMVLDAAETFLFVADQGGRRVLRIEYRREEGTCGAVHSIAGTGNRNVDGRFPPVDALALGFDISSPHGIALSPDGRTLFFTEVFAPCRIYRVDLEDGRLTLVAGQEVQGSTGDGEENERAQLFNPNAIHLDSSGQVLYVVDSRNHRVRRFWVGEDLRRP